MSIQNTYTEEFDWFRMSPHLIETDGAERSIKVMNDACKNTFQYPTETGAGTTGDSGQGMNNAAYKNWRNINLGLGPLTGLTNPVIAGQVRQDITQAADLPNPRAASWFQGVNNSDFKTDGMIMMPTVGWQPNNADKKATANLNGSSTGGVYQTNHDSQDDYTAQSESNVIQLHVPGGLKANTWMPLFQWAPWTNSNSLGGFSDFSWWTEGVNTDTSFWEKYATHTINGGSSGISSGKLLRMGPHLGQHGIRTADHDDTVLNTYDTEAGIDQWAGDGWVQQVDGWHRNYLNFYRMKQIVWWYAHDGAGNSMIINLNQGHHSAHGTEGSGYNGLWGAGDLDSGSGGAMKESSGGYIFKPPQALESLGPQDIQNFANAQRSSWVYKDADTLLSPDWYRTHVMYGSHGSYNSGRIYPAGHRPEIVHGLTKFGNGPDGTDNADLHEPQNFYIHRHASKLYANIGIPHTSYKFGNLVKTNARDLWFNGHGRGMDAIVDRYNHTLHVMMDLSLTLIASHDVPLKTGASGPVKINMFTCGGHALEDGPARRDEMETMFYEFPGVGATYGAIDPGSTVEVPNPDAWENAQALVDVTNVNEAICKASGEQNAVLVPLSGWTEGVDSEPVDDDVVSTLAVTLGGTRKMVLGPQVLKLKIVSASGESLTPAKTIPGNGSDTLNDDITMVYARGEGLDGVTYKKIKDAKVKIWVETP